jgi:NAD(P)-dependent dehydrogenase (short-subunit alcohol dehydrogenase family)
MGRLENRTAVIVHVGSAMARACALRFAAEGAAIMAVDPSAETLQNFARAVTASGRRCLVQRARPDDEQEIMQVAEVCGQAWESVSILLICAALLDWWPAGKDTMRDWEQAIRVNLLAPVFYTKALQPALARSGGGSIIYYGSVDGIYGNPRLPAYSAARGGLIPFTHIAAHEYGPQGIRASHGPAYVGSRRGNPRDTTRAYCYSGRHCRPSPLPGIRGVRLHHRSGTHRGRRPYIDHTGYGHSPALDIPRL